MTDVPEGLRVQRIGSNEQFVAICEAGRGVVYNDFSGHGASGAQYNVVHAASCQWLARSSLTVPKFWFMDLPEATGWLVHERGEEGRAWKRCGTCLAARPSSASSQPVLHRPTTPTSHPERRDVHPAYVVEAGPDGRMVEAWSSVRLPFEPQGMMREFRDDLRSAVARLSAGPTEALHALYTSPVHGYFDVENVLLYNVGPAAFRRSAALEMLVERAHGTVPNLPPDLVEARHHYRYEMVAADAPWRRWKAIRPLASFGPIDVGTSAQISRAASIWYAVRRGGAQASHPSDLPAVFGIDLVLEAPAAISVNLAALAKPLLDGVAAAFHVHDDPASLNVVASRVAADLGVPADGVRSLLGENNAAILGARRLIWPRGDGVQWNPADDLCAAFRLRRVTRVATRGDLGGFRLRGSIVEIEAVRVS
jgi:hypothetical protein